MGHLKRCVKPRVNSSAAEHHKTVLQQRGAWSTHRYLKNWSTKQLHQVSRARVYTNDERCVALSRADSKPFAHDRGKQTRQHHRTMMGGKKTFASCCGILVSACVSFSSTIEHSFLTILVRTLVDISPFYPTVAAKCLTPTLTCDLASTCFLQVAVKKMA